MSTVQNRASGGPSNTEQSVSSLGGGDARKNFGDEDRLTGVGPFEDEVRTQRRRQHLHQGQDVYSVQ